MVCLHSALHWYEINVVDKEGSQTYTQAYLTFGVSFLIALIHVASLGTTAKVVREGICVIVHLGKDSKAGFKRHKGRLEKTQRQATKGAKPD